MAQGGGQRQAACFPALRHTAIQRTQIARGPVDPSIRRDARCAAFERPAVLEHAGVPGEGASLGAKRPSAKHRTDAWFGQRSQGVHRHGGPESRRTIGARPHAPLDLQSCHAAPQVREIDPKHALRFGVVQRHPIDGDIDAALVDAADAKGGVAHAMACVRRYHRRGREPQQEGHVLRRILRLDVEASRLVTEKDRLLRPALPRLSPWPLGSCLRPVEPEQQSPRRRKAKAPWRPNGKWRVVSSC